MPVLGFENPRAASEFGRVMRHRRENDGSVSLRKYCIDTQFEQEEEDEEDEERSEEEQL